MTTDKLEKLRAQKAALEAKIRRELGREKSQNRRHDTRKKILAGAAILDEAESDPAVRSQLTRLLARFLTRAEDRALFQLPALPEGKAPKDGAGRTT